MHTQKRGIVVGLIGENPNDTNALRALLMQRYTFNAINLIKGQTGDRLVNPKAQRALAVEYDKKQPQLVIYIRDLDALASNKAQVRKRHEEFAAINNIVQGRGIFLLHVYQFEALLLADIEVFNQQYKVSFPVKGDPTMVEKPKDKLMAATDKPKAARKYHENDSAELAGLLDYAKLVKNCAYFRAFDAEFAARIAKR